MAGVPAPQTWSKLHRLGLSVLPWYCLLVADLFVSFGFVIIVQRYKFLCDVLLSRFFVC